MDQQMIKIGNSLGVIVPKALRKQLGFKEDEKVVVEPDLHSHAIIIRKKGKKFARSSITPEFLEVLARINKRYGPALRSLAQK